MPADGSPAIAANEYRVLVVPPTRADAEAMAKLLGVAQIQSRFFSSVTGLCEAIADGAGLAIISEEMLVAEIGQFAACIEHQPVWSDVPVIVLSRSGKESNQLAQVLERIGNASVVERPVRVTTLISLIRSSLRARQRQYEVRDQLAERELLFESERQARTEAERAGRMKDEFLATLSHELRTPLNAMLGWSQLLRNTPGLPDDIGEGLSIIERNARSQTQIIEDLLDMSRIISGKVHMDVQRTDLIVVLKSAIASVRPAAQARGVHVSLASHHEACIVPADASRIQQVFWNLLTNAVKFTPKEGSVTVALDCDDLNVHVSVSDTGEGIGPAFLPHVFDRFRQADASTTRKHGGLGLGLSIVKQLVELHGGTITASSDGAQRGSVFTVVLPLAGATTESDEPGVDRGGSFVVPATTARSDSAGRLSSVKVLVVDDEHDARALLRRVLEDAQATVITAASATEAIELLVQRKPDVLVSDIGMPGEDGYTLIGRVRSLQGERGGTTPAIALTAYARNDDRAKVMNAGFQSFMTKPVEGAELIATIAGLVHR